MPKNPLPINIPDFVNSDSDTPSCAETDPEIFFPQDNELEGYSRGGYYKYGRQAKSICHGCPLKNPCLEYALRHDEIGIWGGTTEYDRRRLRRQYGLKSRGKRNTYSV